ncbi:MAG: hypothetical protein GY868_05550 [Deltaproteobacteria bacterium]|nr:hypothetical protein [Deltaproteobacteria bacterium]
METKPHTHKISIIALMLFISFCLTSAAQAAANSKGLRAWHDNPEMMSAFGDIVALAQTYDADNETAKITCVFDSIIDMVRNISLCENNPACPMGSVFAMVIDILICLEEDEDTKIINCFFDALMDMVQGITSCDDDPICILTTVFSMVIDMITCDASGLNLG